MALELAGSLKGAAVAVLSDLQPYERIGFNPLTRINFTRPNLRVDVGSQVKVFLS